MKVPVPASSSSLMYFSAILNRTLFSLNVCCLQSEMNSLAAAAKLTPAKLHQCQAGKSPGIFRYIPVKIPELNLPSLAGDGINPS